MGCVVWVQLETLGAYSVAVLVNIKKRHHEAAEAFGVAHGKGPGEANGSNLKNLVRSAFTKCVWWMP